MVHDSLAPPDDGDAPAYTTALFYQRVHLTITGWIEGEWEIRETIRQQAADHGWNDGRRAAYANACEHSPTRAPQLRRYSADYDHSELTDWCMARFSASNDAWAVHALGTECAYG